MRLLYNRISNRELRSRILPLNESRITVSFYRYFSINQPQNFRDNLYHKLTALQVFGRIYIASEGINAQINLSKNYLFALREILYNIDTQLEGIRLNLALDDNVKSFWVLRIKVRPRIIADGIQNFIFDPKNVGQYLTAEKVNSMSDDPSVLFVDMRNHYEYEIGHFDHAIEIPSDTFREQLPMVVKMLHYGKNKKIVLYCTGGIRCEKASAWMRYNGFKNIYQIEGGIIQYVHDARKKGLPLKFRGKNFVFDGRLGERITSDIIAHCHQCGTPCDNHTNCYNQRCHLLFIQCSMCYKNYSGCCSIHCQKEFSLSILEKRLHFTKHKNNIKNFNKSRIRLHSIRINEN